MIGSSPPVGVGVGVGVPGVVIPRLVPPEETPSDVSYRIRDCCGIMGKNVREMERKQSGDVVGDVAGDYGNVSLVVVDEIGQEIERIRHLNMSEMEIVGEEEAADDEDEGFLPNAEVDMMIFSNITDSTIVSTFSGVASDPRGSQRDCDCTLPTTTERNEPNEFEFDFDSDLILMTRDSLSLCGVFHLVSILMIWVVGVTRSWCISGNASAWGILLLVCLVNLLLAVQLLCIDSSSSCEDHLLRRKKATVSVSDSDSNPALGNIRNQNRTPFSKWKIAKSLYEDQDERTTVAC